MRIHLRPITAALLLFLAACAGADRLAGIPPDQLYAMAQAAGADHDYEEAQTILDRIRDDHPFSRFAVEAELLAADLKFQAEKFEEAAALYRSFEQLHPTHPQVAYTIYRRGLAYWNLSSPPGRDQADTRSAAEAFQKLLYGYADSEHTGPGRGLLAQVRSRLAAHEIHVGRYYLRRHRYAAALGRMEAVVQEFPDTPEQAEAQQLAKEARAGLDASPPNPE
ncbi:MAG TPA: outer membrane protein assembly factor BamD [Deferrisomatales bacterium]|nr:outer membrane protein assembly factor BamD [Deferrisomatales bacterium]